MICSWCSGPLSYDFHEMSVSVNRTHPIQLYMCSDCFKERLHEYGRTAEGCVAMTFDVVADVAVTRAALPMERN